MPSKYNLKHDHPRMSALTWWHSYANLTLISLIYTQCAKMNFPCQGCRNLSY